MAWTKYESPLGSIILAGNKAGLCGLWFEGQKYCPAPNPKERNDNMEVFDETKLWLNVFFSGREPDFMPRISMQGTAFQEKVWLELMKIPFGTTVTYSELAKRVGCNSARAIGNAVGHNPISIIVPCHRVVGCGGKLTGYAGGLDRKAALLELERITTSQPQDLN